VYPSEYEGFGIPPLEAMSCGCPVICGGGSSIPEVVGAAGEYFDASNVESIRTAIERVALSDIRRSELISAGYAQCQRFSWDKCADETLNAYRLVL
jgi:glycosyltransferase involved in cell wall biosynthesis